MKRRPLRFETHIVDLLRQELLPPQVHHLMAQFRLFLNPHRTNGSSQCFVCCGVNVEGPPPKATMLITAGISN